MTVRIDRAEIAGANVLLAHCSRKGAATAQEMTQRSIATLLQFVILVQQCSCRSRFDICDSEYGHRVFDSRPVVIFRSLCASLVHWAFATNTMEGAGIEG